MGITLSSFFAPERALQLIDFEGLQVGAIKPRDFDLIMDVDRRFLLAEIKLEGRRFGGGQAILLHKLQTELNQNGATCILVHASHVVTDPEQNVIAAECRIEHFRVHYSREWQKPKTEGATLLDLWSIWYKAEIAARPNGDLAPTTERLGHAQA